ncbi:MAG: chromosomal replication initiator protein DnaA [Oscillospiraceae bacterium]|jgi:chromosomal replication initiator protein|nr:chromosomal replication initiator protein DnaA [Oscillospiraceae bacterium]
MNSNAEVYKQVCDYLRSTDITDRAMQTFIEPMILLYLDGSKAILNVENVFKGNLVKDKYLDALKDGFFNVLGFEIDVEITANENVNKEIVDSAVETVDKTIEIVNQKHIELEDSFAKAHYEYTFETFIKGESNNFALAACMSITNENTEKIKNNPLFIHGNSGLGKTHLMFAIANDALAKYPDKKIIYVSSETYGNEFIESIAKNKTSEFRAKYRTADILLLDDVQFFSGKEKTQEELFHTFNDLYNAGKNIVLTSDKPAKDIHLLEDRVRTRFEWGIIAKILPPEKETRVAIIKRKAELLGLELNNDVIDTLAEMIKSNIRQLESAVKKLKALYHFSQVRPTVALAQGVAMDILRDSEFSPVTAEKVLRAVSDVYKITPEDICSNKRSQIISLSRKITAYILKETTEMSLKEIGEKLGGRDHSTIIYAVNDIQKSIDRDENIKNLINDIIKNLTISSN